MTGPDHYAEAERLAEAYKDAIIAAEQMPQDTIQQSDERHLAAANAHAMLAKAQVHATLANAAAAAFAAAAVAQDGRAADAWRQVIL